MITIPEPIAGQLAYWIARNKKGELVHGTPLWEEFKNWVYVNRIHHYVFDPKYQEHLKLLLR
jgi:hypothetical protein